MLPGKWYAKGDTIVVLDEFGQEETLTTSWEEDRYKAKLPQLLEEKRKAEELKKHLEEKRLLAAADNLRKKGLR